MPKRLPTLIFMLLLACIAAMPVGAASFSMTGSGTLTSSSGAGTQASPYILNIAYNVVGDTGPAVLTISGGNSTPLTQGGIPGFLTGNYFQLNITNNTGITVTSAMVTLFAPGTSNISTDPDGYSFAQGSGIASASAQFSTVTTSDGAAGDRRTFSGGMLTNGATASVSFPLTENNPRPTSLQAQITLTSVPESSTYVTVSTAILGFGLLRKKLKK